MRRCLLLAVLAALVLAAPADAYKLGGKKWPGRTITYHVGVPQYADAIAAAARAWNASGVRIRFKEVAGPRRALLRIVDGGVGGPSGAASLGYVAPRDLFSMTVAGIPISGDVACGDRVRVPGKGLRRVRCVYGARMVLHRVTRAEVDDPGIRNFMAVTAAHELGHILGLRHSKNTCAVMSYQREEACPKPAGPWQVRCRLVEPDDLAGAIRRYGGRAQPLAPEFCDSYPPVPAPTALDVAVDGHELSITWTNTTAPELAGVALTVERDRCVSPSFTTLDAAPGGTGSFLTLGQSGPTCVTVTSLDAQGRLGRAASVWVDLP
jgi:hypothetical protein